MENNEVLISFKTFRELCWLETFQLYYFENYVLAISISVLFEKSLRFVYTELLAFSSKTKAFLTDQRGTEQGLNSDFLKSQSLVLTLLTINSRHQESLGLWVKASCIFPLLD